MSELPELGSEASEKLKNILGDSATLRQVVLKYQADNRNTAKVTLSHPTYIEDEDDDEWDDDTDESVDESVEMCTHHYIGGSCDNPANLQLYIMDGCDRPLFYCDDCWKKIEELNARARDEQ